MDLVKIIEDAVSYPFSDWKKILILGILAIISSLGIATLFIGTLLGIKNVLVIILLFIIGYFIFGFLIDGYNFRIIKTSISGERELPEFNNWVEMFVDGIKVSIVFISLYYSCYFDYCFCGLICIIYFREFSIKSFVHRFEYNFKCFKCHTFGSNRNFIHYNNSSNKFYGNSTYGK